MRYHGMENLLTRLSTINFSWRNLLFEVSSLVVKAKISLQYTDILWDYEHDHNAKYKYQCKVFTHEAPLICTCTAKHKHFLAFWHIFIFHKYIFNQWWGYITLIALWPSEHNQIDSTVQPTLESNHWRCFPT